MVFFSTFLMKVGGNKMQYKSCAQRDDDTYTFFFLNINISINKLIQGYFFGVFWATEDSGLSETLSFWTN